MPPTVRRELLVLRWSAAGGLLLTLLVSAAAIRLAARAENLGEITVERINVVDADGTLRLVIANKDRMPAVRLNGRVLGNRHGVAGLMFYNDLGDENGGLIYRGNDSGAGMTLTLDQYKQDQTLALQYMDDGRGRMAGVSVWDRPDAALTDYFDELDRAQHLPNEADRAAALESVNKRYPAPKRVFVGKTTDRAAAVVLSDGEGRPRLRLTVALNGEPAIEFLDERGRVTRRFPIPEEPGPRDRR